MNLNLDSPLSSPAEHGAFIPEHLFPTQPPTATPRRPTIRPSRRKANTLLFLTERFGPEVLPCLSQNPKVNLRVVSDCPKETFYKCFDEKSTIDKIEWIQNSPQSANCKDIQIKGHYLASWADLLFIVMDASMTPLMLTGCTFGVILGVLRCWDTTKRIVMLPEMSIDQWKNPIWAKQCSKLRREWDWVHVLPPALWDFVQENRQELNADGSSVDFFWDWEGQDEMIQAIDSEVESIIRAAKEDSFRNERYQVSTLTLRRSPPSKPKLPAEIWTLVLDYLGDWELAKSLGIYTHLPVPHEWASHLPRPNHPQSLEYNILTQPIASIRNALSHSSSSAHGPSTLSPLATKLIFKFSLTQILTYLASHQKDIFWTSFGLSHIPHKASIIYNSPPILEWWRTCPAVLKKEYGPEALDGASRAGFVEVLDWWLHSGLQLCYTERSLESASAKGHIEVLKWWKAAHDSRRGSGESNEVPLKIGKSILAAAQSGRADTIHWWDTSGIPYSHEDGVARFASTHGHVNVLTLWRELKGNKMIFDNQVLVGATKNGHAGVLEWWKKSGFAVEYKTCDIEEAMEDAVGGGGESEVRDWWGRNGLNLGVGTSEWMKVKTL